MSDITTKQEELRNYQVAQNITKALRDISISKLQTIRDSFEKGKGYYKEIENLYRLIKYNATKTKTPLKTSLRGTGVLSVAITSNKRFYGSLNNDVMAAFLKHVNEGDKNSAYYIVGKTGQQYVLNTPHEKKITFFNFETDEPTVNESIVFLDTTRKFDHVLLFYPKFIDVFKQEVGIIDITYITGTENATKKTIYEVDYIFEPEVEELFWFFDTQVRYILFNQVMLEIELSRMSARLVRMSIAEENATYLIKKTKLQVQKAKATLQNMQLLETFAGIKKWNT